MTFNIDYINYNFILLTDKKIDRAFISRNLSEETQESYILYIEFKSSCHSFEI